MLKRLVLALACLLGGLDAAHATAGFAGYQASGSTYTSIGATIRVPWVSNSTTSAGNNIIAWVGIEDGTNLAQVGMSFSITAQGAPSYGAFYEMYPAGAVNDTTPGHTTVGGDIVKISLTCTANCTAGNSQTWAMKVQNVTEGWTWSPTDTLQTSLSKFDIMTEDLNTTNPLPNFGTLTFTNISVNGAAPSWGSPTSFQMTDSFGATANPSSVSGTAFSICAGSSSSYTSCARKINNNLANGRVSVGRF